MSDLKIESLVGVDEIRTIGADLLAITLRYLSLTYNVLVYLFIHIMLYVIMSTYLRVSLYLEIFTHVNSL